MHLVMTTTLNQDVKSLFAKEFDFVSTVLNQVKLPIRVEDSGKLYSKHVHCALLFSIVQNIAYNKCTHICCVKENMTKKTTKFFFLEK